MNRQSMLVVEDEGRTNTLCGHDRQGADTVETGFGRFAELQTAFKFGDDVRHGWSLRRVISPTALD